MMHGTNTKITQLYQVIFPNKWNRNFKQCRKYFYIFIYLFFEMGIYHKTALSFMALLF